MTTLELFDDLIESATLDFRIGTKSDGEASERSDDFYHQIEMVRQRIMEDYTLICFLRGNIE